MNPARRFERRPAAAAGLAPLLALLTAISCGDHATAPDAQPIELPPVPVIVSNPVTNAAAGQANGTVYVSMPPGSVAAGDQVQITNVSTGVTTSTGLIDGGFDPVGVPALEGHTLRVTALRKSQLIALTEVVVEARRPPTVVRTSPSAKKRDVPLNAVIVVVFSEPIDSQTASSKNIRLLRDDVAVTATLSVSNPVALTAELRPALPLIPETGYTLVVSGAVSDQNGETLGTPVIVDFTTQALLPGSLTLSGGDNQSGTTGRTLAEPLRASVRHEGSPLEGITVRWACSECREGSGGPSVTPESVTDSDGTASAAVTLGSSIGTWNIEASIGTAVVRFVVRAVPPTWTPDMSMASGDNQSDTVRATLADPLLVLVRDGGVPVEGVAVRWVEVDGEASGTFLESGSATVTTLTGADGLTSVRLALGERTGRVLVQATIPYMVQSDTISFMVSARSGNVVSLVIDSTRTFNNVGLVGLTGVSLSPFHVLARDAHGNDVDAQSLEWSVVSGTGVVTPVPGSSSAIATPLADGLLVVSAAAPGVTPVTFNGHGVAATILTVGGADGHCNEGSFVPSAVEVTAHRWVAWTICWDDASDDGWTLVGGEWHWGYQHDVTFEDGVVTWPSTAGPTANWSPHFRVFTTPGTYRFRCTLHSTGFNAGDGETGTVTVR